MKDKDLLVGLALVVALAAAPVAAGQETQGRSAASVDPNASQYAPSRVAPTVTLPAGTLIIVRTVDYLSSDRLQPGDTFSSLLEQPVLAQGWVLARRSQTAIGRVAISQKAARTSRVSQLAVELVELVLADGQQVPVRTQLIQSSAGNSGARDAALVGGTAGIGAAVGAAGGGGQGAAIGAAAGAVAGIAGVMIARGRPAEIPPETVLTFRLEEPLTIDTTRSQQAFAPVTPNDFPAESTARSYDRYRPRVYSSPREGYYYPPYGSVYSWYPPAYGVSYRYYGYGHGPGIYAAPRVFVGPPPHRRRW